MVTGWAQPQGPPDAPPHCICAAGPVKPDQQERQALPAPPGGEGCQACPGPQGRRGRRWCGRCPRGEEDSRLQHLHGGHGRPGRAPPPGVVIDLVCPPPRPPPRRATDPPCSPSAPGRPVRLQWSKILPLGAMFFCILFNYTILRDTKVRRAGGQLSPLRASPPRASAPASPPPLSRRGSAPPGDARGRPANAPGTAVGCQRCPRTSVEARGAGAAREAQSGSRRPGVTGRPPPALAALPTQDVLVVTAPGSGAEIIPFLKTWVNLPMAIGFTILYAKVRGAARGAGWQERRAGPPRPSIPTRATAPHSTPPARLAGSARAQRTHSTGCSGRCRGPMQPWEARLGGGRRRPNQRRAHPASCPAPPTPAAGQRPVHGGAVLHLHHPVHYLLRSVRVRHLPGARDAAPHG